MQPGCDDHDGFQPGLYPVRNVTNIVKVLHVLLRQKEDFSYLCLIQIHSAEDIQPINKAPFQKNLNELYRKKLPMINGQWIWITLYAHSFRTWLSRSESTTGIYMSMSQHTTEALRTVENILVIGLVPKGV